MEFSNLTEVHSEAGNRIAYQTIWKDELALFYTKYIDKITASEIKMVRQLLDQATVDAKELIIFTDLSEITEPIDKTDLLSGLINSGEFEDLVRTIGRLRRICNVDPNNVFDISILTSITKLVNLPQSVEVFKNQEELNTFLSNLA